MRRLVQTLISTTSMDFVLLPNPLFMNTPFNSAHFTLSILNSTEFSEKLLALGCAIIPLSEMYQKIIFFLLTLYGSHAKSECTFGVIKLGAKSRTEELIFFG